jgi:hypothetical protein
MTKKQQWQTIGEVCVDSGHLIICDPCRGAEGSDQWFDNDLDLNECAKIGIRTWELTNDHNCPIAAVVETGLGDGMYKVEARYEDLGEWGERVAEIRIRFLPHPQIEMGDDDLAETEGATHEHLLNYAKRRTKIEQR